MFVLECFGSFDWQFLKACARLADDAANPRAVLSPVGKPSLAHLYLLPSPQQASPANNDRYLCTRRKIYMPHARRLLPPSPRLLHANAAARRSFASQPPPPPSSRASPQTTGRPDRLSIWPFVFILALGSGLFALTVRNREGVAPRPKGTLTEPIREGSVGARRHGGANKE